MSIRVPWENPSFGEAELGHVRRVLEGDGARVLEEFEQALGDFIGNRRVVTVSNGTLALLVALLLIDLKPGDRVIAPTYTFAAVVNPILLLGGTPVLVDCDPATVNLDLDLVEALLEGGADVKALFHVDVSGVPPDHDRLARLSERYGFAIIEDAAEALGSEFHGKGIGALPHIATMSFQTAKQLTCGEGGAVVVPDDDLLEKCKLLRHHGMSAQYEHTDFGLNFRLSSMNGAVGLAQMERLGTFLDHRAAVMERYRSGLGELLRFQDAPAAANRVSWGMALVRAADEAQRDGIRAALDDAGVQTRINWKPVHRQPYHSKTLGGDFSVADEVFRTSFTLPLNNGMSLDDADLAVDTVRATFA